MCHWRQHRWPYASQLLLLIIQRKTLRRMCHRPKTYTPSTTSLRSSILFRITRLSRPQIDFGTTRGETIAQTLGGLRGDCSLAPASPPSPPAALCESPPSSLALHGTFLQPCLSTTFIVKPTELTRYRWSNCRKHASMRSRASSRDMPSRNPLSRRLKANRDARP